MKCSKTFTLHVDPGLTDCPVFQATVVLGVPAPVSHFVFYSDSATPGIPHKFFANGLNSMVVVNADTRAIVVTVPLGTSRPLNHGVNAPGANKIIYIVSDSVTSFERIEGMDVDGYAITGTAYIPAGDSYDYVEYDAIHNEIGSIYRDGTTGQPYFRRHNATTMAQIASTAIGAINSTHQTLAYDPVRDRYYTSYTTVGPAYALRAYNRTTAALSLNVPFANQLASVIYEAGADVIYTIDVNGNFFRCNAGTGAVEITTAMGLLNGLRPMQYWGNNSCLVGLAQNPGGIDIYSLGGLHVCNINGGGVTVGLFGDQLGVQNWLTHNLLIYQV